MEHEWESGRSTDGEVALNAADVHCVASEYNVLVVRVEGPGPDSPL